MYIDSTVYILFNNYYAQWPLMFINLMRLGDEVEPLDKETEGFLPF